MHSTFDVLPRSDPKRLGVGVMCKKEPSGSLQTAFWTLNGPNALGHQQNNQPHLVTRSLKSLGQGLWPSETTGQTNIETLHRSLLDACLPSCICWFWDDDFKDEWLEEEHLK